jgi:CRP-like cAMP-binding protein
MPISRERIGENRILAGLPSRERDLIASSLEVQELHLGDMIVQAGAAVEYLYFPLNSAISIVNQQDTGRIVEVTVIGKEGCCGATVVQGSETSPCVALVQVQGPALSLPTAAVTHDSSTMPYLWKALSRYTLLLYRHSVISVGCSQFHSSSQRVARWLKAHWHRTGLESFPFTTAFFAAQVGINEKTVAEVLDEFERDGIVQLKRKNITISNQARLGDRSCPCFQEAKEATDEYLLALIELARTYAAS